MTAEKIDATRALMTTVGNTVASAQIALAILTAATGDQEAITRMIEEVNGVIEEGCDVLKSGVLALSQDKRDDMVPPDEVPVYTPQKKMYPASSTWNLWNPDRVDDWGIYPDGVKYEDVVEVITEAGVQKTDQAGHFGWTHKTHEHRYCPVVMWRRA